MEDWIPALVLNGALILAIFMGRNAIKAFIERGVEHSFNTRLAKLEGDLRKSEHEFRSSLRLKEAEIEALRSGALAGMASRQELLTKRRIDAAEHIWASVIELAPAETVSGQMAHLKFDELAKVAPRDERVQQLMEFIGSPLKKWIDPETKNFLPPAKVGAQNERLFVNPLVWALYSAYPGLFTNPLAVDFSACDASLVAGSFAAGESRVLPQLCDSHLRHERREEAAVEASGTATGDPAVA